MGEPKPQRRLPWQAVLSPSLEMLQTRLDAALGGRSCLLRLVPSWVLGQVAPGRPGLGKGSLMAPGEPGWARQRQATEGDETAFGMCFALQAKDLICILRLGMVT